MRIWTFILVIIVILFGASIWYGITGQSFLLDFIKSDEPQGNIIPLANLYHVTILNGTEVSGLARDVSLGVEHLGVVVNSIANAPHHDFRESILINRKLDPEAAEQLAGLLGGIPVVHEYDGRMPEDAVLVLGKDYQIITDSLDIVSGKTGL